MEGKILIIDDDELVTRSLKKLLVKLGYDVLVCNDPDESFDIIRLNEPDVILLDIYFAHHHGLEILKDIQKKFFQIPVIMITGYADVKIAINAMKSGAFDFLLKPLDFAQLQLVLKKAFDNIYLRNEVDKYQQIQSEDKLTVSFFGKSPKIKKILKHVERLAKSADTTVLIDGESGSGKEMFAKFIHQHSPRATKPFLAINCSAIPKDLAESELFGHEKGAFTGAASKTKLGKFELANGGTLLLDEIGDLTLDLQVKLLRVLQEKKFYRVGGEREISVDVRVIAATNKSLEAEVESGNFREDLFYRLNVANVTVPALRDRKDDIPVLAYLFLKEFSSKFNIEVKGIDEEALNLLQAYYWKGNVRELRNVMERALLIIEEDFLKVHHFHFLSDKVKSDKIHDDKFVLKIPKEGIKIDLVLKTLILETLKITNGNQVQAAKILGLSRSKLRYRIEQLGIEVTKQFT